MDFFSVLSTDSNVDIILRLFVAIFLGAVLGLERVFAHKSAGPRTYALVSMGSALLVIVSELVSDKYLHLGFNPDPLKVASNIVVGVGFLGAGIIVFKDSTLIGLTTAAGLWMAAGIGIAVGFGYTDIAFIATLLTMFIFTILYYIEHGLMRLHDRTEIKTSDKTQNGSER